MKNLITTTLAAFFLLAFAIPASAQGMFGPSEDCNVCWSCDAGQHKAPHIPGATNTWTGPDHWGCYPNECVYTGHAASCGSSASADQIERTERLNEILNTMEGDERLAVLLDEFPANVHLASGGNAIEVLGEACQEGRVVGRLTATMQQAVAVIDSKADSRLAANF